MKQVFVLVLLLTSLSATAQTDSPFIKRIPVDTSKSQMNMDAVYNRPFLQAGKIPVSIGGYLEANSSYFVTNGITEGLSFQLPRMTVFISSTIKKRIKFLSEIEFEEGGKEINIEFASMDITLHPLANLRGGIIMNPIGAFNQNHDGPKWEFVSRPIASTTIIPATWSNVGFGMYGKYASNNWVWAYEAYATNGFDDRIINNDMNRTWLPASKENGERFEESFNGVPLVTAKTAIKHRKVAEIGLSWMGGAYNKFREDGIELDKKRRVDLFAIDANTTIQTTGTYITGEWVWAFIDVPGSFSQQFGDKQQGGFIDIVQPIVKRRMFGWDNSTLNVALRVEHADYNVGQFTETGGRLFDHTYAITPAVSFRPSQQTVIRANYRYQWEKDILGNPESRTAGIQIGFSTYF
ncbi:hypothetical protein [Polluticoccus soli]|uniref:hypothetical protein n=1 Tax=Polluticoccus soli TaxID=3034150 RepID=UPI0023E3366A|nr:hypothetical protein [Flavipsychrobacter sp. JY13-12]